MNNRTILALSAVLMLSFSAANPASAATGKVVNGNFSKGNKGFDTQYAKVKKFCDNRGSYTITPNPAPLNCFGDWDHTTGSGNMLAAQGSTQAGTAVWSETITVNQQTNYQFTFWGSTLNTADNNSAPSIQAYVNGTAVGSPLQLPPTYDGGWHEGKATWNSGSKTSVTISLVDLQTAGSYNDFTLDDIKLKVK